MPDERRSDHSSPEQRTEVLEIAGPGQEGYDDSDPSPGRFHAAGRQSLPRDQRGPDGSNRLAMFLRSGFGHFPGCDRSALLGRGMPVTVSPAIGVASGIVSGPFSTPDNTEQVNLHAHVKDSGHEKVVHVNTDRPPGLAFRSPLSGLRGMLH